MPTRNIRTSSDSSGDDLVFGSVEDNILEGGADNDVLVGDDGNDRLDGGTGFDWMEGGRGNDLYVVDDRGDAAIENADSGFDTVVSSVSYSLGANIEALTLTGTGVGRAIRKLATASTTSSPVPTALIR